MGDTFGSSQYGDTVTALDALHKAAIRDTKALEYTPTKLPRENSLGADAETQKKVTADLMKQTALYQAKLKAIEDRLHAQLHLAPEKRDDKTVAKDLAEGRSIRDYLDGIDVIRTNPTETWKFLSSQATGGQTPPAGTVDAGTNAASGNPKLP